MIRSSTAPTVLRIAASPTSAEPLRILAGNVDSGGSNPNKIAQQLAQYHDYHIAGLTEVGQRDFDRFTAAVAGDNRLSRRYIGGLTGVADRLQLVSYRELFRQDDIQILDDAWRHRALLVCQFRDLFTDTEFVLTLNHFVRTDSGLRLKQAEALRQWPDTMRRYRDRYATPKKTGTARFSDLEVQPLRATAALVLWRWHLSRAV